MQDEASGSDSEDDDVAPSTDLLPDEGVLPQGMGGDVEFDGEDLRRLRSWVEGLPRGRSRSERALLNLQDVSLLQGGTVCIIRGRGEVEMGSADIDMEGQDVSWESGLRSLERCFRNRNDWDSMRLWELVPEGCRGFVGGTPSVSITEAQTRFVPRSIWRPLRLSRTSRACCVGCFCFDLESRENFDRQVRQWSRGTQEGTLQSWRYKKEKVHQFVFRCHSCGLNEEPDELWRGMFPQNERGCVGRSVGWEVSFRVFIYAAILSRISLSVHSRFTKH